MPWPRPNLRKLTLQAGATKGTLTKPKALSINQDGDITAIGTGQLSLPIQKIALHPDRLELTIDGDHFQMHLVAYDHATLTLEFFRPWTLDRVEGNVMLATRLVRPQYRPHLGELRKRLRAMVQELFMMPIESYLKSDYLLKVCTNAQKQERRGRTR